ncbi:hypothetical protein FC40_GL001127 [Ligilactobacillus hayakitensis DSM 18933 = JCM 14209]|uniref:Uncharacterized protein n=1 Tax=Ligilactobacillus hayakitensis DSM 18933 = JCM 14209 TaxID=1423755 RepID=A0A0R1WI96_9LACO|nr:hypothetical protein FC40_GL001127 [Ligilactobacillus hayakitensis DSM 18933 = JCM 14209]
MCLLIRLLKRIHCLSDPYLHLVFVSYSKVLISFLRHLLMLIQLCFDVLILSCLHFHLLILLIRFVILIQI